jgi:NADH-quinone oxidoreductase subunit H
MADLLLTIVSAVLIIPISLFLGVIYSFLIRKLSAKFQWRVGPLVTMYSDLAPLIGRTRIWQPLYDILKLFGKDVVVPANSRKNLFTFSPYLSLFFAIASIFFIPFPGMPLFSDVPFSLIIASYLLIASIMFTILGPVASGSPWGAIGARREVELFLVAELGFVLSLFAMAFAKNSLSIFTLASTMQGLPYVLLTLVAGTTMFAAMLGKLHIKPFDMPEAECEIVAGPYTEYSGRLLGIYFLAKVFILYSMVALFIAVFLPPLSSSWLWVPVYLFAAIVIVFLLTVVQVLNPRYRIGKALNWYIKIVVPLAILSFIIAFALRMVA